MNDGSLSAAVEQVTGLRGVDIVITAASTVMAATYPTLEPTGLPTPVPSPAPTGGMCAFEYLDCPADLVGGTNRHRGNFVGNPSPEVRGQEALLVLVSCALHHDCRAYDQELRCGLSVVFRFAVCRRK